jgi:hypothetical protein
MNSQRFTSKIRRGLYVSVAAAFWFFLAASAPHRVHHFFEQFPAADDHPVAHAKTHEHTDGKQHSHEGHHNGRPSQQTDCAVLSVAQHAQASLVQAFSFAVLESAVASHRELPTATASTFNPAPFSQRAPPLA